jgi:NMD protein affecting ribosome stability and mRNA decay
MYNVKTIFYLEVDIMSKTILCAGCGKEIEITWDDDALNSLCSDCKQQIIENDNISWIPTDERVYD